MKHAKFTLIVFLVLTVVLTGNVYAQEEPIRIGASLTLSGRFGAPGQANQQGYDVWAEIVNGNGGLLGRHVEMVYLDNESDTELTAAQYEQLIAESQVDLVFGPFSSPHVIAGSEVAYEHGYAFVEPAGGAPDVFNRGLDNLFFAQSAPATRRPTLRRVCAGPAARTTARDLCRGRCR